jgi:hypothetical protein
VIDVFALGVLGIEPEHLAKLEVGVLLKLSGVDKIGQAVGPVEIGYEGGQRLSAPTRLALARALDRPATLA